MNPIFEVQVIGYRIPDTVVVTLGVTLTLTLLAALAARRLRTRELSLWQAALETFEGWLSRTVEEVVGEDPRPYVPLIGSLMLFIAASNALAVVPIFRPPTSELSTPVALAGVVFLAVPYYGVRRHGLAGYLRGYLRPTPLLLPVNVLGELTRTLALCMRLFGNAMSGELLGAILLLVAGVLVPVPLMLLGLLTGLIQAYIFGILAAVYIAAAVQVEERSRTAEERT